MLGWLKSEKYFLWISGVVVLLSSIFLGYNYLYTQYTGIGYSLVRILTIFPVEIVFIFISYHLRVMLPSRFSQAILRVLNTLGTIFIIYAVTSFACFGMQFTPFHLIDTQLLHFDQALGFSSSAVYSFTQHHAWVKFIAQSAYSGLSVELALITVLLAVLSEQKSLRVFYLANVVSLVIAMLVYYFFPTTAPAAVVGNVHFSAPQYGIVTQWYEIHMHLPNSVHVGDLVGFPSYHVIWATLLTYACRHRKWLFYPMIAFNVLVVASTMLLGWHFMADVLGGFVLAAIVITVAEYCLSDLRDKASFNRIRLAVAGKSG